MEAVLQTAVQRVRWPRLRIPFAMDRALLVGAALLFSLALLGAAGHLLWRPELAFPASSPPGLPPVGWVNLRGIEGSLAHPLGTEDSGRDLFALLIVGAPNTMFIGLVSGAVCTGIGIALGFAAGFFGGRLDDVVRMFTDVAVTIPPLLILIVLQSAIGEVGLLTMALLIAAFAWPKPTRQIRAQVLSMRESGYVKMANASGASSVEIMFREILPNLLPYLAACFTAAVSYSILAAIGLEVLGLGPTRIPTLGTTVSSAIEGGAIFRGMWWWWGFPTAVLVILFLGLLLVNVGLDEFSNPRLSRGGREGR